MHGATHDTGDTQHNTQYGKQAAQHVTAKIEVPRGRAALVAERVVTAWECQPDGLWRQGLRPRTLANLEGGQYPVRVGSPSS